MNISSMHIFRKRRIFNGEWSNYILNNFSALFFFYYWCSFHS